MRLISRLSCLCALFLALSSLAAQAIEKQTEFGGVKLGAKATSLGFKLDEDRAFYRFKQKYLLWGFFSQPGHPIFRISIDCHRAGTIDQLGGIKCGDDPNKLFQSATTRLEPMCSTDEDYEWETQFVPYEFYSPETNHFWRIDYQTKKIGGFGISLAEGDWAPCVRKFAPEEIAQIKLGMSARDTLGQNLRNEYHGASYLREDVTVSFDKDVKSLPITKLAFECKDANESAPNNPLRADCGTSIESFLKKYGHSVVHLCDKYTFELSGFYKVSTKEFWSLKRDTRLVEDFGLWEKPDALDCNKLSTSARMINEVKLRKPHSAPLPLTGEKGIMRIKGMTLGDGPTSCPQIESVSFTTDRLILNICSIEEDENVTRVYFDVSKKFIVKIERTVFVNDQASFMSDALQFYGKDLAPKDEGFTTNYEFGDTKNSRGLKISSWNCYLVTDGCRGSSAKFRMTFLMTDIGAVQEAIDEGYKAYRKKEF